MVKKTTVKKAVEKNAAVKAVTAKEVAPKAVTKNAAAPKAVSTKAVSAKKEKTVASQAPVQSEDRYRQIEMEAFLMAEKDNFKADPLCYWIAAEKKVLQAAG
jgi:exo-beta-1,3-glucanase (GH17 family)